MKIKFFKRGLNWTLITILALFYLIFEFLYILKMTYFLSLNGQTLPLYSYGAYIIDWLLVTVYMILISLHTSYLLEKKISWARIIPLHLFFSILISLVIRFVIDGYQILVGALSPDQYSIQIFIQGLMHSIDVNYLIYFAMIFIIYVFHYLDEIKASKQQKHLLETQLLDTRIKMLTTQLQPHFLFNTLNSISSLIDINKEKAQDTLADLSDFLRQILFHMDSNFVPVHKEIQILNPYLNILRTRFHETIEITTSVQEDLLNVEIPALILQPLIENAVKHGNFSDDSRLIIHIKIFSKENNFFLQVFNSGRLKPESTTKSRKGLGLKNLRNRLSNIYGTAAHFSIEDTDNNQVLSTVEIPLKLLQENIIDPKY